MIFLLVWIGLATAAHATDDCDQTLRGRTSLSLERLVYSKSAGYSKAQMRAFTTRGLPELRRLALENELTIPELLTDLTAAFDLMLESYGKMNAQEDNDVVRLGLAFMKNLDGLIGRTKFKAVHYERLDAIMYALESIAIEVARAQILRDQISAFDPLGDIDEHYVTNLLTAAEDGMLDRALAGVEARKRRWTQATRVVPRPVVPAVEPEIDAFDVALELAPAPEEPVVVAGEVAIETNLAVVLKDDHALRTDVRYQAQTARGTALELSISPYLLKQHDEEDRFVVRRLLRGVLVGRSHAGIKMLPAVGAGVIEVKAIMHGHKRILGCLEGRTVRLLKMIDIKADGGTYSRRIPHDLCAPAPR